MPTNGNASIKCRCCNCETSIKRLFFDDWDKNGEIIFYFPDMLYVADRRDHYFVCGIPDEVKPIYLKNIFFSNNRFNKDVYNDFKAGRLSKTDLKKTKERFVEESRLFQLIDEAPYSPPV